MKGQWKHKIFTVSPGGFDDLALEIFRFQYGHNRLYRQYTDALGTDPLQVKHPARIPFLPIRFFKSHTVQTGGQPPQLVFESSGTTGNVNSRHFIADVELYRESFTRGFQLHYGKPSDWCIIGLLPSYLERGNSSLVYMVNELIGQSGHAASGFYLDEFDKLSSVLDQLERQQQPTLLIGVTFALLDFAERYAGNGGAPLHYTTVMETGGMKGRRKEMIRPEVHDRLRAAFGVPLIHSEYGMTELLSQAYSHGNGIFQPPPWMRVLLREEEDPLSIHTHAANGAVNVIDLANIQSCSFIATDDAGRIFDDNSFEIIGRLDNSDLRGCSLLVV